MLVVAVLFVLVMAFMGRAARVLNSEERQARRRAAEFPLLLDLQLFEVDGEHVTRVRIGDVEPLADDDHGGTTGVARLDQLHRLEQFAVMRVQRVQHTVSAEHVEQLAIAGELRGNARLAEYLAHFAVVHVDQPNAIVDEALITAVGGPAEEMLDVVVTVDRPDPRVFTHLRRIGDELVLVLAVVSFEEEHAADASEGGSMLIVGLTVHARA